MAKRYRFTGKERDEESGLYYHGARYYMPWLGRWAAADPLQGEMPVWSSYNYGYCNPVKWTDSTGMMPDPDKKDSHQAEPEKDYHPIGKQNEMIPKSSFPYRWGGSVTDYADGPTGRNYSVLEQGGKNYSWINYKTGKAGHFSGGKENKDSKGNWSGYWMEYMPTEKATAKTAAVFADAMEKGLTGAVLIAVGAPIAIEAAGTEAGGMALRWASENVIKLDIGRHYGAAVADFGAQLAAKNGDIKAVNFAGPVSAGVIGSPLWSAGVGSGLKLSIYDINNSIKSKDASLLINKLDTYSLRDVGVNTLSSVVGNKFGQGLKSVPILPGMSKWGKPAGEFLINFTTNKITDSLSKQK